MKKFVLKLLTVGVGMTVVLLIFSLVIMIVFPATVVTKVDYVIELKTADGQPLTGTEVVVWKYDEYSKRETTDEHGRAIVRGQSYHWIKVPWRPWQIAPDEIPVRLMIPGISELRYRFEVSGSGTPRYHVFDDSYDYFFGDHWLGEFNATQQTRRQISDLGKIHTAIAPPDAGVILWKSQATIRPDPAPKPHVTIELTLQQSGIWSPPLKKN